jgi:chromosome segregation protein
LAAGEARQATLDKAIEDFDGRIERLRQRRREIDDERARIEAEVGVSAALEEAKRAVGQAAALAESTREAAQSAEDARAAAQGDEAAARDALQAPEAVHGRLAAEETALAGLLASETSEMWPPLIDAVAVEHGLEAALGAALGDDLSAPLDEGAPVHWRALPPLAGALALPHGCEPLSNFVRGPAALARRLSQIGVVPNAETGRALSARLAQGQRLVTKEGDLWRWDGFTTAAGAPTAAAKRLSQRNRLEDVRRALVEADAGVETARARHAEAQVRARGAVDAERAKREQAREAFAALNAARDAEQKLAQKVAAHSSRLAALGETASQLEIDLAETLRQAGDAREARASLPDLAIVRRRLDESRASLAGNRDLQRERQAAFDRLIGEARTRRERLEACAGEYGSWETRAKAAGRQIAELTERKNAAEAERNELAAKPAEIAAQRSILLDLIENAQSRRREAADRLAEAENRLAEADKALKAAEVELHAAREERVRREAAVAAAEQARSAVAERIAERLNCGPEETLGIAELKPDQELPALDQIETRLHRLVAERENMGPVNLRAEQESREVEEQIASLQTERADLVGAIARLRQAIAELNREGRERLLASFDEVNRHFTELFVRLFGGGRAFLQLTESEDPLEAGLEIMASPPGKKLQMLSLLSGGEQALTALSLLFAVFMTNPAPICVLDEVDAPLDDANVDRFCTLLEEIAHHSQTRFLLITHHRMTMARMDRLFGVTMPERGVSQLVSVDLQEAESFRATA